jgi:hypothetical protein
MKQSMFLKTLANSECRDPIPQPCLPILNDIAKRAIALAILLILAFSQISHIADLVLIDNYLNSCWPHVSISLHLQVTDGEQLQELLLLNSSVIAEQSDDYSETIRLTTERKSHFHVIATQNKE